MPWRFCAQRLQNPLIKEYTLNLIGVPSLFLVYSLIKEFWSLWVHVAEVMRAQGNYYAQTVLGGSSPG